MAFYDYTPMFWKSIGRLQSLDWTSGLDWWTDTKNHFYAPNETYSPVGLHDASY